MHWSMSSGRRSKGGGLLTLALAACCFLWPGVNGHALAAEGADVQAQLQEVQDLLARATAEFNGPQQSRSIVLFEQIAAKLENLRTMGVLAPHGREVLVQAYELEGRAYYNIGLQEKAAQAFRALIQVQPTYTLTRSKVSPKIVDFYNAIKKTLVGYVAVSSKPAGARVSLNGEFLSLTDFFPLEALAGEYRVEIARDGYQSEVRTLSIAPQATETLEVTLTRVLASCFFVTQPSGVEVWVDGVHGATTTGSPSPELQDQLRAKGLDPAQASGRVELPNLALGTHTIEFRKRCFETVRSAVEVPEARDYDIEPVRLEESLGALRLTSDPPGARVFLDGEVKGVTPLQLDGVCSGTHRLEVKHAAGKFMQDLSLGRNEEMAIDCPIRPSLAFLGVVSDSAAGEKVVAEIEERLTQNLSGISSLNILKPSRDHVDRVLEAEQIRRRALVPGAGTDPDVLRRVTERLAAALEVQGFLIAYLPEERLQRTATLHLLAAGNTVTDPTEVVLAETASFAAFARSIDKPIKLFHPWIGLITVDTKLASGTAVLRVVPGGPAAQAGVQAGEAVISADGAPIAASADLVELLATRRPKDRLALHLRQANGATRLVEVTVGETPQEVPSNDPLLLYNKVMMDLRQQVEGYPGTEAAAFARLNLALCSMHFGDFVAAHEHLVKARTELPRRPGLSQGSAIYYLAVVLERLGYRKEATDTYSSAAASPDATVGDNDGPLVAPLATPVPGI
jgi:tetratricopeptide (TPR) repeat protein